jgi:hypothetical protein
VSAALPFVIPSEAEGSAVQRTSRGNSQADFKAPDAFPHVPLWAELSPLPPKILVRKRLDEDTAHHRPSLKMKH